MNAPMEARLDARGSYSTTHRIPDPRLPPRRRGTGRVLGITLSLLTAIGAGAAGGYSIWKTQLVRPALVRHLPRMPALVADLAPVQAASAATEGEAGSAAEAPVRRRRDPAVPAAGSAEASPAPARSNHAPDRTGPWTTSITGVPASRSRKDRKRPGSDRRPRARHR